MSKVKPRYMDVKPQRAVDWNEKAIAKVIAERGYVLAGIKADGMRCLILRDDDRKVHFLTRAGIEIPALAGYAQRFEAHWDAWRLAGYHVLDTEVWVPGVSFEEGCGMLRRDAPVDKPVKFMVLDLYDTVHLQGKTDPNVPVAAYFARVPAIISRFPSPVTDDAAWIGHEPLAKIESTKHIEAVYLTSRGLGFEGLVVKDPSQPPRNGKVTGQWKVKPGCGAEFAPGWEGDGVIVGYVWGDDGKANAGKIVGFRVKLEDGTEVNATGLTQDQMRLYTEAYGVWDYANDRGQALCAAPFLGRYAECKAMEKTAGGSLRHPTFVRFRDLDSAKGVKA